MKLTKEQLIIAGRSHKSGTAMAQLFIDLINIEKEKEKVEKRLIKYAQKT